MSRLAPLDASQLPRLPQVAEAAMMRIKGGAPSEALPAHVRDAARSAIPAFEARARCADPDAWQRFLLPLAMMARNPPTTDDIRRFAHACAAALQHIPACCLSPANQRAAACEFAFWPSVADLAKLLEPDARDISADLAALRRISEAPLLPRSARDAESPEDRAANAERNRQAVDALKAQLAGREKPAGALRPSHISPAQRVRTYRALGQHATADAIARAHGVEERTDHDG